ncbi:MAG: ferredoxin [Sphingomonadaceae bacterium]|nr:ferredoxin [Sphingomonadaceae bacterium]
MYVCICNAIKERELRAIACSVSGDAEAAYAALGKEPDCGQCLCEAEDILAEERAGAIPLALAV